MDYSQPVNHMFSPPKPGSFVQNNVQIPVQVVVAKGKQQPLLQQQHKQRWFGKEEFCVSFWLCVLPIVGITVFIVYDV
jgi:hypothetical protein